MGWIRWAGVASALIGCSGPEQDPDGLGEDSAVDTGDTGPEEVVVGSTMTMTGACEVDPDNGLRGMCTAKVSARVELEVVLRVDGRPDVVIPSGQTEANQLFPWYFVPGQSDVDYEIRLTQAALEGLGSDVVPPPSVTGSLTTLTPPEELWHEVSINGTAPFDHVLTISACDESGAVVVLDGQGRIVWWQSMKLWPEQTVNLENVTLTEDDTILVVFDELSTGVLTDNVVEIDFSGQELVRWAGLEFATHHDATKKDGVIYALFREIIDHDEEVFLVDGVYGLSVTGAEIVWRLEDHVTDIQGNLDFSHANFIGADEEGLWMSFRHLSTVAALSWADDFATPFSFSGVDPVFAGGLQWLTLPPDTRRFFQQHDPQRLPDGGWLLLDNGAPPENSEVTILGTDQSSVWVEESWTLPYWCSFQGGSRILEDGTVLATCAPERHLFAFEPGNPDSVFDLQANCATERSRYVPRYIPLDGRTAARLEP